MTEEEKRAFLKKMGFNPRILNPEPHITKRKMGERRMWAPESPEDVALLLKLNKTFNEGKEDGQKT